MKKFSTLIGAGYILLWVPACDKAKLKNPESRINVGGTGLKTRKFEASGTNGKARISSTDLRLDDESFNFGFEFNVYKFPTQDSFHVSYGGVNINQCNIGIVWKRTQYLVDQNNATYLQAAAQANGKGMYTLPPTWFYNQIPDPTYTYFIRGNDSILISGTFYEANDVTIR